MTCAKCELVFANNAVGGRRRLMVLPSRPPIHFLHPHRGGGTTLCALAERAGERINRANNCLFGSPFALENHLLQPSVASNDAEDHKWTCTAQLAFTRVRRLSFVARETYLLAPAPGACDLRVGGGEAGLPPLLAPLCTGFVHVTVLREPLARIPADYCLDGGHWRTRSADGSVVPLEQRGALALAEARSDKSTSGFWDGARWSNYYTRILLGREAFARRALPPDALVAANRTLGAFAAVVVLERLDAQLPLLQHALGWSEGALKRWRASPRANHITPQSCSRSNWSAQLEQGFAAVNRVDLALYEWWGGETERRLAALGPTARTTVGEETYDKDPRPSAPQS